MRGHSVRIFVENIWDHVIYFPPSCGGGNKTEGSNIIMSTSFELKFCSNKIIDVDHYDARQGTFDCNRSVAVCGLDSSHRLDYVGFQEMRKVE